MTEQELITEYSSSHQNSTNQLVHYICVPVIFLNVLAYIYFYSPIYLTLALIFASLVFYYRSLRTYLPYILVLYVINLVICYLLSPSPYFIEINTALFVLAWIGQFWGHKVEGKSPSFLRNIFFLLVGPAWVAAKIQKKIAQKVS
jgi:uncharacterized membrane protein YGL010W